MDEARARLRDLSDSTTGTFLVGRVVNGRADDEPTPGEEIKAWLVYPGAPII